MGALCTRNGAVVYGSVKDIVLGGVKVNLDRKPLEEQEPNTTGQLVEKMVMGDRAGKVRISFDGCNLAAKHIT